MKEWAEGDSENLWSGPLTNLLKRTFDSLNSTFEEIVTDFAKNYKNKSIFAIRSDIDSYLNLENEVFKEVHSPLQRNIYEILSQREISAINMSPFKPEYAIIIFGIYHHFLEKWLEHFQLNEESFKAKYTFKINGGRQIRLLKKFVENI